MNIYVWKYVGGLTSAYHDEGGVLAVAATKERAVELIEAAAENYDDDCPARRSAGLAEDPDLVLPTEPADERVMIFPDAGCC